MNMVANVQCLRVGGRYKVTCGHVVVIHQRVPYDKSGWPKGTAGNATYMFVGRVETYADGTPGKSNIPLVWHETGLYGSDEDHPLTIVENA